MRGKHQAVAPTLVFCCSLLLGMSRRPPKTEEPKIMHPAPFLTATDINPDSYEGQSGGEPQPAVKLITTSRDWEKLWKSSFNGKPPRVDFDTHFAVAVFAGAKPTGGYGVEFLDPQADDQNAAIRFKIRKPSPGSFVTQAFTQPYAVKIFKKTKLKISTVEVP